jgi:uncharacterized membrane protein YkvA (DUF1232 family)
MRYGDVIGLLNETKLSPEKLAEQIAVSNSTYRRWLKEPSEKQFPREYEQNVAAGIYRLLNGKSLDYDSARVNRFLETNVPEFFQAAIGRLGVSEDAFAKDFTHQDQMVTVLSQLGSSSKIRDQVDTAATKISRFSEWGEAWKSRIRLMKKIITSKHVSSVDKLVAYGALFYLILPFDLTPDTIPVFGYVDDFGILGFAAVYYCARFPDLAKGTEE